MAATNKSTSLSMQIHITVNNNNNNNKSNAFVARNCLITMSVQEEKKHREEPEWRTEIF